MSKPLKAFDQGDILWGITRKLQDYSFELLHTEDPEEKAAIVNQVLGFFRAVELYESRAVELLAEPIKEVSLYDEAFPKGRRNQKQRR